MSLGANRPPPMALARLIRGTRPFARQCNATLHPALAVRSQRLLLSSAPPSTILDDPHIFPDQVLEEEKTGFPVGLPQIKEEQLWKPGAEGTLVRWINPLAPAASLSC